MTRIYQSINPIINKNLIEKESISELVKQIDEGNVESIYFSNDLKTAYARKDINKDGEYDMNEYTVVTTDPSIADIVIKHSNQHGVKATILDQSVNPAQKMVQNFYSVFDFFFIPSIIFFIGRAIWIELGGGNFASMGPMKNNKSGLFGANKGNDKENMKNANISLSSWAGSPEIFQECTEVVTYITNRTLYKEAGAEVPRGILLEGPPGTGKTLLAKAIASECEANFISVASSEFVELYVGMGAAKVRNLFKKARDNSPTIIFMDEIDAVGKQRGTGINSGNDEREQTLNQILAEMDGFTQNDNILIIAATNRRDVLDSALLRPGRFDRIINVPLPDTPSRLSILNVHTQNKKLDKNVDLEKIATYTAGYSGAQLKNLVNEAAINAVRQKSTIISESNLKDALEKLTIGIVKKNDTRSPEALRRVAIHEMGHAFIASIFSEYFQVKKVSIQSTYSGAGGYTMYSERPEITEAGLYTKDMLKKRITIALGGKAAEETFFGSINVSLGATQDLKQANNIARQMIGNYGMGEQLKTFYNENTDNSQNPFLGRSLATGIGQYSESIKTSIDTEVLELVKECYEDALKIIENNKNKINIYSKILTNAINMDGEFLYTYSHNKKLK